MDKLIIGSDPEFFLKDKKTKQFVAPTGMLGGSKKFPRKTANGAVQEDGCAVEVNTIPVDVHSPNAYYDNLCSLLEDVKEITNHKYDIVAKPEATFKNEQLEHPHTWLSGCDPDYSIATLDKNEAYEYTDNVRFAGGHIHIGSDVFDRHPMMRSSFIRAMDLYVGIHLLLKERNSKRINTYGQLGRFRYKDYGFEYRTPSPLWTTDEEKIKFVFKQISRIPSIIQKQEHHRLVRMWEQMNTYVKEHRWDMAKKYSTNFLL